MKQLRTVSHLRRPVFTKRTALRRLASGRRHAKLLRLGLDDGPGSIIVDSYRGVCLMLFGDGSLLISRDGRPPINVDRHAFEALLVFLDRGDVLARRSAILRAGMIERGGVALAQLLAIEEAFLARR